MESGLELLRKIASGELPPAPIQPTLDEVDEAAYTTCIVLPPPA